jgi:hypothetical protein
MGQPAHGLSHVTSRIATHAWPPESDMHFALVRINRNCNSYSARAIPATTRQELAEIRPRGPRFALKMPLGQLSQCNITDGVQPAQSRSSFQRHLQDDPHL